jgi:hypothetical protein
VEDVKGHTDTLLRLLEKNRGNLMKGDYRLLWGILEKYGAEDISDEFTGDYPDDLKLPRETVELLSCIGFSDDD